ncbi:TonB-dependent receptor [Prolixibacteraceae bacterium]|nr:TonB-dependent receptor [Prolixibacteraceae bacterium]
MKQVNQAWHRRLFMGTMLLLLSFVGGKAMAQQLKVTGTVKDAEGAALPGVTVLVKGTTMGTITDFDGNYLINIKEQTSPVLKFSYVGFTSQEVTVSGKTKIDITLKESAIALNEVVAVGYGVMKKSDVTGATVGIKSDDILRANTSSVNEALQGKMAGVSVSSNSGAPGGDLTIRIRGNNSITGGNAPLVVIDGFAGGSLKEINANDIESIEVLKDASATAIYGSRGANGVILVTTKSGKKGEVKVSYNGYYGQQSISKKLDVMDAASYAEQVNAKRSAFGVKVPYTEDQIADFRKTGGTNWQDEVYVTAPIQNHDVSISGGTEKSTYLFSGQYLDQDGIMKNSNYNRYNYRLNFASQLSEKLKLKVIVSGFKSKEKAYALKWPNGTPPMDALLFEPTLPAYTNGSYTESSFSTVNNPIADVNELNSMKERTSATLNASLAYNITDKITFTVSGGFINVDSSVKRFNSDALYYGTGGGRGNASNTSSSFWQNTNMLSYIDTFGDHNLNITLVNEQSSMKGSTVSAGTSQFDLNRGYYMFQFGAVPGTLSSSFINQWSLMSYLGRANYSFKGKYLVTASLRADGASKFAKNAKWGYFPSASLAWRVKEEGFLKDNNTISNLKLRASYGTTGSQASPPYRSIAIMNVGGNYSLDGANSKVGVYPKYLDSPKLSWETTSQFNTGVDLALLDGRINFTGDLYYKKTQDLLLQVNVPYYSGFSKELRNVGSLENKGVDLSLGVNLGSNDFKYNGTLTANKNVSKILDLGDQSEMIFISASKMTSILQVDRPMGQYFGYQYEGVWKTSEAEQAKVFGAKPGDAKFKDIVEDGVINSSDITVVGNAMPDWTFGFSNNFSYKGLDLSLMFTASVGNEVYNYVRAKTLGLAGADAVSPDILNRWTPENENTDIASFGSSAKAAKVSEQTLSSQFIEDASFLRLKNVTLGYTFNPNMIKSIGVKSLRVYGSLQNAFTLTNYKGYDPEVSSSTDDMMPGFDNAPYPSSTVWNLGVNISF